MKLGHNVFLTGEPGSGKTYTLNKFIAYCKSEGIGVGVTASTGIAATHIGGMTIHSWSGIGIHDEINESHIQRMQTRKPLQARFKKTRVLIIDEISMLDGVRLNMVNLVCQALKNNTKPFGGLQVILCGDLFQLPPVTRGLADIDFAHFSQSWKDLNLKICYLSEQHRQEEDESMLSLLRQIRGGELSEDSMRMLEERLEHSNEDPDVTRLYSHNIDVDKLNADRLAQIENEPKTFTMHTHGSEPLVEQLQKSCLAPEKLELKVGAQVLCVANNPVEGYMNGTRAEVVGFDDGAPVIRLADGKKLKMTLKTWAIEDGDRTLAEVSQYPLRLAWAITVHKSQGMSLDSAEVDLSRAFTPGMGYVALSRLRQLSGLYLRGINQMALRVSPEISEFDASLRAQSAKVIDSLSGISENQLAEMHHQVRTNLAQDYAEYDKALFEDLRSWRTEQAKKQSLPAYMILDDKTLIALSAERPQSEANLLLVPGIGPKKLKLYATDLITIINQKSGKLF